MIELQENCEILQRRGQEIGVTTKRLRRCGWLDLPIVAYTIMINGYTSLCMTKLDILDGFSEIKIAVAYHLNGTKIGYIPSNVSDLAKVSVEYITLSGWSTNVADVRNYSDLPYEATVYIRTIEQILNVPSKLFYLFSKPFLISKKKSIFVIFTLFRTLEILKVN